MKENFYLPTRIVMDEDCIQKNAALLSALGKKALLVTGAHSARINGSLNDVTAALESENCAWVVFDKIPPNPTVASVYDGAKTAKDNGCDFVIAIGGGSPMDASKAIAMLAVQDIPQEKIFDGGYEKRLPLCCIPTTAGTGSEVTQYSVLTNDAAQTKTSLAAPLLFPDLALLDSRYLRSVPAKNMIPTVIDSLSHSVEGYLSARSNCFSDTLALRALSLIGECLSDLTANTLSDDQREKLLLASTLGGMVIAHSGTTAVHAMGYSLTYFHNIDHGRANGLLMTAFLEHVRRSCPERINAILSALGFADFAALAAALDALLGTRENISHEDLIAYSDRAAKTPNSKNCMVKTTPEDIRAIYLASFPC